MEYNNSLKVNLEEVQILKNMAIRQISAKVAKFDGPRSNGFKFVQH